MSYSAQALLSQDGDFINRVSACAAVETDKSQYPKRWAEENIWWIAAAPGFADQYEYALNSQPPNPRPGDDPAVITDAQILSAVQALWAELHPSPGGS